MHFVLVSLALSLAIPVFHALCIQIARKTCSPVLLMFLSFGIYILICIVTTLNLNENPANLSHGLLSSISTSIFMCLFYAELFSMAARGFSMRILTDVYINKGLSLEEIIIKYADGKGISWLLEKRITGIKNLNLVTVEYGQLRLSSRLGIFIARIGLSYKRGLKLGRGG